jgi:hypothetical protein
MTAVLLTVCITYKIWKGQVTGITSLNILRYDDDDTPPDDPETGPDVSLNGQGESSISSDSEFSVSGDLGDGLLGAVGGLPINQETTIPKTVSTPGGNTTCHTDNETKKDVGASCVVNNSTTETPHPKDTVDVNNKPKTPAKSPKAKFLAKVQQIRDKIKKKEDQAAQSTKVVNSNNNVLPLASVETVDASNNVSVDKDVQQNVVDTHDIVLPHVSTHTNMPTTPQRQDAATSPIVTHKGARPKQQMRAHSEPRENKNNFNSVSYKRRTDNTFLNRSFM